MSVGLVGWLGVCVGWFGGSLGVLGVGSGVVLVVGCCVVCWVIGWFGKNVKNKNQNKKRKSLSKKN